MAEEKKSHKYELRTIDAWRDECGWTWNESSVLEEDIIILENATTRQILRILRERGWLSVQSAGKVRLQDDWPILEIQDKNTREPILALMAEEE